MSHLKNSPSQPQLITVEESSPNAEIVSNFFFKSWKSRVWDKTFLFLEVKKQFRKCYILCSPSNLGPTHKDHQPAVYDLCCPWTVRLPCLIQHNKSSVVPGEATIYHSFNKHLGDLINGQRVDTPFLVAVPAQHILSQRPSRRPHYLWSSHLIFNKHFFQYQLGARNSSGCYRKNK